MSHQTGIAPSSKLDNYLKSPGHENDRCIKITIVDEELFLEQNRLAVSDYESDWDRNVIACIEDNKPCYVFYRLDSKNSGENYNWVFIAFCPNEGAVKDKMLYAATRASMKRIFGDNRVSTEMFATLLDEVTLQAYRNHTLSEGAAAPMTDAEIELKELSSRHSQSSNSQCLSSAEKELLEVSKNEHIMRSQMEANKATLPGLSLPVTLELTQSIEKFKKGFINYVQIKLDTDREELKLWDCSNIGVEELGAKVPEDEPRYHMFNFGHTFEDKKIFSAVFIYSCPGYNTPVKQRMMYSSTKSNFLSSLEELGVVIAAKTEISGGEELTEATVYDLIHPQQHASRQHFAKPKAPAKGGRRLIKKPA